MKFNTPSLLRTTKPKVLIHQLSMQVLATKPIGEFLEFFG